MGPQIQNLIHIPYGIEHPYKQEPYERFPRQPIEGQPILLGVVSIPAKSAERIWATWYEDGSFLETEVIGKCVKNEPEKSSWEIILPQFMRGQKIYYRIHAVCENQIVLSETYSFTTVGWVPVGRVLTYYIHSTGVILVCESEEPYLFTEIQLIVKDGNILSTRISTRNQEVVPTAIDKKKDQVRQGRDILKLVSENEELLIFSTCYFKLVVFRQPYQIVILSHDDTVIIEEAVPPAWLIGERGFYLEIRQRFASPEGEGFFGFGERFNNLNQRGNILDLCVYDEYMDRGSKTYLPIPFFLSTNGYGLYIKTNRQVRYDLNSSLPDRWSFEAEIGKEATLEYALIIGQHPIDIIRSYSDLTEKPKLPPTWAFGPWMSGNEWNSQARVMEELQKSLDLDIPTSVLVIEAWSDESTFYIWNDAEYRPKPSDQPFKYSDFTFPEAGRWPDPKGMIDRLHELGIRLVLWQIPVMKKLDGPHPQHNMDEAYMIEKGCCVQNEDGTPYRVRPLWFHNGMLMDFTNPEAVRWWLEKRAYLVDELGVDGFKTDGGEHLWSRDARFHNGMQGAEAWNLYPNLYVGAYYNFITEKKGGDALTFSRAGYTGAQAYPMHWAGDEYSTWETLQEAIIASLNAGLSGVPFLGWDIAGFSGEIPTAELYLRSTAMAAFCPLMQYHSDFNHHRTPKRDRTPWNIAERTGSPEVVDIYRGYARMRMRLLPYIESEAAHCVETGEPLMRPLLLDWPEDPETWKITDQYCFGRALLVAPVIVEGQRERKLYLPVGEWQDLWNGQVVQGGQWIEREAPVHVIPVYRRMDIDFIDLKMDIG